MRGGFTNKSSGPRALVLGLALVGCSSSSPPAAHQDAGFATGGSGGTATGGSTGGSGGTGTGGSTGGTAPDAAGTPADSGAVDSAADAGSDGAAAPDGPAGAFALTSSAFMEGGMVDVMYRCTGTNVSPPLAWGPGPAGTMSYAVSQVHNTAVHWVLWDIPVTTLSLPMGVERAAMPAVPAGSKQAKTGTDGATWFGYTGPCPGGANLDYVYAVYAMPTTTLPGLDPSSTATAVYAALEKMALKKATLTVKASK